METRRLILAIVLSTLVWLLWLHFFKRPMPPVEDAQDLKREEQIEREEFRREDEAEKKHVVVTRTESSSKIRVKPSSSNREDTIEIETDRYTVYLSNRGGVISSYKYNERDIELVIRNNRDLFKTKGSFDFPIYLSEQEFIRGNAFESALWDYKTYDSVVKFYLTVFINGRGLRLEKIYNFYKKDYYFRIEYNLVNLGRKEITLPNGYMIVSPSDFLGPDMDFDNRYNKLNHIYYINGDFEKTGKGGSFWSKKNESVKRENGDAKWAGIASRYFLLILIAERFIGSGIICDARENAGYRTGMYIPVDRIKPGGELTRSFKVYVGEKNKDKLTSVDTAIIDAADVNKWIEPLRDFLLWCLIKINLLVGNLGWSLVIFSLISKIILLPLSQKSTESMKKMQALAPKMNELKEKYKDRPELLNKEMVKLYKNNKVNPLGGCLPMLLQLPFFFALWSALINSIDLWQAPFIFWIKDLSLPDTVYRLNSFNINILPIIMTATSFMQQRLTTSVSAGAQQKFMMTMMPLVFIVIFWNMPSGLVLYWTLQNLMQIVHQIYINKKSGGEDM